MSKAIAISRTQFATCLRFLVTYCLYVDFCSFFPFLRRLFWQILLTAHAWTLRDKLMTSERRANQSRNVNCSEICECYYRITVTNLHVICAWRQCDVQRRWTVEKGKTTINMYVLIYILIDITNISLYSYQFVRRLYQIICFFKTFCYDILMEKKQL